MIEVRISKGWPEQCGACDKENIILLAIGEEEKWESGTAHLCLECLEKGALMLKKSIEVNMPLIEEKEREIKLKREAAFTFTMNEDLGALLRLIGVE